MIEKFGRQKIKTQFTVLPSETEKCGYKEGFFAHIFGSKDFALGSIM